MWDMFKNSLELAQRPIGVVNVQGVNLGVEKPEGRYRYSRVEGQVICRIKLVKETPFLESEMPANDCISAPPVSGTRATQAFNGRYRYAV